jgi:hypothetical protein
VQQRRDDAVGGAGHPARVGGAPVDVVGVQVERVLAGGPVRRHRAVHVHGALRRAGGAAGEVQQREVLRPGRHDVEFVGGLRHQRGEVERAGHVGRPALLAHQQHVAQRRQLTADLRHLALVEQFRGHQYGALAELDARGDRLRAEGGKEGRDHRAVLEAAQHRDVQLGDAAGEQEQALALADAERLQHVGEAVGQARQLAISDVAGVVGAEEAEGGLVAQRADGVAFDGLVGDVQPAAGQAGQLGTHGVPGKRRARRGVVRQIRRQAQVGCGLADDRRTVHRALPRG